MNIGQAARASGVSAKLIRYYEQIHLILPAGRTGGNYRSYGQREVDELRFIRRARTLGYSVEEIRELLRLWRDPSLPAGDVKRAAEAHLAELQARIGEMQAMAQALRDLADGGAAVGRPELPSLEGPPSADPEPPPSSPSTRARRRRSPPE